LCALKSTMIPNLEQQDVMGKKYLVPVGHPQPLGIQDYPVTITFAKIGENMIVDPALMEELICDARISFCINKNSLITSMQKNGSGTFTTDELITCAKNARDLAPALQQLAKDYERDLTNM
jgi:exosome complex component RRP42